MSSSRPAPFLSVAAALPLALAGGSDILLGFLLMFLAAVIYGLYTTGGSGIAHHPYGNVYGGAPLAKDPCQLSGCD